MSVLVLGKSGMLGFMLHQYLRSRDVEVCGTQRSDPQGPYYFNITEEYLNIDYFEHLPAPVDYVINCIGETVLERRDIDRFRMGFYVNATFPHCLHAYCRQKAVRMIHISTDAVFSGKDAYPYDENHPCNGSGEYALSKILGEVHGRDVLNIRCSIVGRQMDRGHFLLEWFLSQKDGATIKGFVDQVWNGVTTLQLSEFCREIMEKDLFDQYASGTGVVHFSPNKPLTKYDLLCRFKEVYQKDVHIEPFVSGDCIDRTLLSVYDPLRIEASEKQDIKEAIVQMKYFTESRPFRGGEIE